MASWWRRLFGGEPLSFRHELELLVARWNNPDRDERRLAPHLIAMQLRAKAVELEARSPGQFPPGGV